MAKKFGISKETQGSSIVPIPAPVKLGANATEIQLAQYKTGYIFPIATLVNVVFDPEKPMKESGVEVTKPVLIFIFKDSKNKQFTHVEFPVEETDQKYDSKREWFEQRVKHIWDETIGANKFPDEGIGSDLTEESTFGDYFKAIADAFNKVVVGEGDKQHKLYALNPVYIKLTYNGDRLQFPLFPNFLQKAKEGDKILPVESILINPTRDVIEIKAKSVGSAASGLSTSRDNNFGGSGDAGYDFPDV